MTSLSCTRGFPGGSDRKASACNAGDPGLIPGLGRSPGEGNGNWSQYSCLENSTDRGDHGVAESRTRLSDFTFLLTPRTVLFPEIACLISSALSL